MSRPRDLVDLWIGTDDGVVHIHDTEERSLPGVAITAIDVSGSEVWCVADDAALWCRSNGDWVEAARSGGSRLCCVRATHAGVLVGGGDGRLLRLTGGALVPVESFDRVDGRDRWWNVGPLGPTANVRSLAESPDGVLFVNVHVGGIYRSADGGASWSPTIDQEADVHEVLALGGGRIVAATGMSGLVRSADNGGTWESTTDGLSADGWGGYTRSVAVWDDDTVLVTGSRGAFSELPGGVDAGVYRWSRSSPTRLERCTTGLPDGFEDNIDTGRLTSAPGYAAFGAGDTVYVTVDAGHTWQVLVDGLPSITCVVARPPR